MQEQDDKQHALSSILGATGCGLMQEQDDKQPDLQCAPPLACCGLMQEQDDKQPTESDYNAFMVVV